MRVIDYKTYWIAHNRKDVVHYGYNEPPAKMETGQPYLEEFDNEEAWRTRLTELGVNIEESGEVVDSLGEDWKPDIEGI